jgi:membrane fusion protein, copper/silver efflux system
MLTNDLPTPEPPDDSRTAAAEPQAAQGEIAVPAEAQQRSNQRGVGRWFGWLLLLGLVSVGYVNRAYLLRFVTGKSGETARVAERKILYWQDPMHPAYTSNKPGTAPDCGMDLVPVYADGGETSANLPPGAVRISAEKQQLIGVQYGTAAFKAISRSLRAVGRLTWDETKIVRIHPRIEGWVEQVFVDFTGKQVGKGQPLISIYSPELWQTQQEYLLALRGRNELAASPFREASTASASLLEATRKRLELWDIEMAQLEHLEHTGKPFKALTLYAPSDGFVLTRNAFPKQRVTPETELYTLADLSTIWVIADVYESEAPEIKLGQAATITLSYAPGRAFRGKVSNISPQLDSATRTLKVRIEVPNPGFVLKPDMFANVELEVGYGKQVVVPQEAVLDSGAEQMVFVAYEGGYFEPRKVQLGAKVTNEFIVLGGLKAGERIVTSANFLIDSESKLKSAAGGMGMPGMDHGGEKKAGQQPPTDHSQHTAGAPTPTVDHSQHQTGNKPAPKQPAPKQADHRQHQPLGAAQPEIEDHAAHSKVAATHDHAKQTGKVLYYYCPMHEEQRSDQPGKCPKCKMSLIPKHADKKEAVGGK